MPPKRDLDIALVSKLRENGGTWQQVAGQLGWNVSALRARLHQEGYFAHEYKQRYDSEQKSQGEVDNFDGVPIDWSWAEKMFMAGCEVKDVASSFGVNERYFSDRYRKSKKAVHPDLAFWVEQCRAKGRCALKMAQYENLLKRRVLDHE